MDRIPPRERTLPALLERQAAAFGSKTFLRVGETPPLLQRDARVDRTARRWLRGRGRSPRRPRRDHGGEPSRGHRRMVRLRLARRDPRPIQHGDPRAAARARPDELCAARIDRRGALSSSTSTSSRACRPSSSASGSSTRHPAATSAGFRSSEFPRAGAAQSRSPMSARATRSRSSTRPAPPARQRASCARRRSSTGGRAAPRRCSAGSRATTCSTPASRSFTRTR